MLCVCGSRRGWGRTAANLRSDTGPSAGNQVLSQTTRDADRAVGPCKRAPEKIAACSLRRCRSSNHCCSFGRGAAVDLFHLMVLIGMYCWPRCLTTAEGEVGIRLDDTMTCHLSI